MDDEYWVPEHVRAYLRGLGFRLPLEDMEPHIRAWHSWMRASGSFYDYEDKDGFGRVYEVHRRSIHPAMRVCREWGSLLLNDKTTVACDSPECTEWLAGFFDETGFLPAAQATVVRAFGLGTGAWALWADADARQVRVRHFDARMVVPLSWDEDGVRECAFVTRAFWRGRAVDQLQMHLLGPAGAVEGLLEGGAFASPGSSSSLPETPNGKAAMGASLSPSKSKANGNGNGASPSPSKTKSHAAGMGACSSPSKSKEKAARGETKAGVAAQAGSCARAYGMAGASVGEGAIAAYRTPSTTAAAETYKIVTVLFDEAGAQVTADGVCGVFETGSPAPTFAIVRPAVDNTRVDTSPYGQSVFADAIDAVQAVDLCFDAMVSEVDAGKMRVFLSDTLFDREPDGKGGYVPIPFGRQDCTVFRKVESADDTIQEFAPDLRTDAQARALQVALQVLGDACGFGVDYFDIDDAGYLRTATEVSSDNSALMRNVRRHERALEKAVADIARAVLQCARAMGEPLPDEGCVRVAFDDSIITDTAAEKRQDMDEVAAGVMGVWEYRVKWYGEDEGTARERANEVRGKVAEPVGDDGAEGVAGSLGAR